jgi:glycosyltransferase involved in cell wall biosynthesis
MKQFDSLKIALIYDRINKFGGAERLLLSLHRIFPKAPLYTLVHEPSKTTWAKDFEIIPSFFNRLSFFRSHHEILAPIASFGFESFDLSHFDLVISITSAEAKSVITSPQTLHLCYCLTPTRYLWIDQIDYPIPKFLKNYLKNEDKVISQRPDYYLSISNEIKKRLKDYYQRDSEVIYPPVSSIFIPPPKTISLEARQRYLCVGRQVSYKKIDLVINAFNKLGYPLTLIGIGRESSKLRSLAKENIAFKDFVTDEELINFYQNSKALIFPQLEDFGLVSLEAQACGTPVIAYAAGGALETIINQKTGLFIEKQTSADLIQTVRNFEANNHEISPENCIKNSQKFSEDRFFHEFSAKVKAIWQHHQLTHI